MRPVLLAMAALRFFTLPLGLVALVALGAHAGADLLDDGLLAALEALDAWLDAQWSRWPLTWPLVDVLDAAALTLLARLVALGWELAFVLAFAWPLASFGAASPRAWRQAFHRALHQPTPLRWGFPLLTAVLVGGGLAALVRLSEATAFASLAGLVPVGPTLAGVARTAALLGAALVAASLGTRAVGRALLAADDACALDEEEGRRPLARGLWRLALGLPLAVALLRELPSVAAVLR